LCRATKYMMTDTPLRRALFVLFFLIPTSHRVHLPLWLAILHV
jgi:hypothetical protein